ncbi:MAG: hypothetical protein K6C98_09915 [Treponema sp.]|nr:hypothetical protein [Treponema sp.]
MSEQITFYLPLGLEVDGKTHRAGKMHLTTTIDELNIQENEDVSFNSRYRDILLLASVIDEIGEITNVTKETIMELYEADFLYLQLLYNQVNGNTSPAITRCETCGTEFPINLPELYANNSAIK